MRANHNSIDWAAVRNRLAGYLESDANDSARSAGFLNETLHRRALQLATRCRQKADAAAENRSPFLTFRVAGKRAGMALASVGQVFPRVPITPVPGKDIVLLGIANINGSLRSIVDARVLLNLPADNPDGGYVVLLQCGAQLLGLCVDEVDSVTQIDPQQLASADNAALDGNDAMVVGMTDDRILVLDAERLIENVAQRCGATYKP